MDCAEYREYCLKKPGVTEGFPFDNQTLVFKVMNKMFALCDVDLFTAVNLKCDPERALELRERFPAIIPGYHMNKVHWNTVQLDGSISDNLLRELTDHSYQLIVNSLPKKVLLEWQQLCGK